MLNRKTKNILRCIFSFFLVILIVFNSNIVNVYSMHDAFSIKVQHIDEESSINADDFVIQFSNSDELSQITKNSLKNLPDEIPEDLSRDLFNFTPGNITLSDISKQGDIEDSLDNIYKQDTFGLFIDSDQISSADSLTASISDDDNSTDERADDNEITTNASILALLPDLIVSSITTTGTYPFTALGSSNIKIVIANSGSATAGSSSCGIKVDGQLAGTFNVPSLQAGYMYEVTVTLTGILAGNHTIQVIADYNNSISESNEANNTTAVVYTWKGNPDLAISKFTASKSSIEAGSDVTFQFTVANIGNADAAGTFYTDVMVNGTSIGSLTVSNLGAQQTASGSFTLTFSKKGSYNIQLKADSKNNIVESNENNNTASLTIQVKIAEKVTISGTLRYKSFEHYGGSSTLQNLSNYPVVIYDKNLIGSTQKASVTTDSSGKFSVTINNAAGLLDNGCSIYLAIPMDNSYVNISGQGLFNSTFQFETQVFENYQEPTLNLGTMTLDASELMEGALNIYHWVKVGKDFYQSKDSSLGKINIRWEPSGSTGSYFDGSAIYISGNDFGHYNSTVIVHEYGHYIMNYRGVNPNNAGGSHTFETPSTNTGTAYSEAYATFISTQARNRSTYEDWYAANTYFGLNLSNLNYISSSGNHVIPRRSLFFENAKMEAFTGGAMHTFATNNGFNNVNNVVTSRRLNNSIEFYNAYMNNTSSSNKVAAWQSFNKNHSAFDYTLPQVSISGSRTSGYRAVATDDVGIARLEWYLDGTKVATGETYAPPASLGLGVHSVSVRAYDYEGDTRGTYNREDINGNVIRTAAYSTASTNFTISSAPQIMTGEAIDDMSEELPNMDFISNKSFDISNKPQLQNKKIFTNDKLILDDNTDLYLTGVIDGAVDSINIVNQKGEIEASIKGGVYSNEFTIVRNLRAGEYTLQINTVSDIQQIPYNISAFAVPTIDELALPKAIGEVNTVEINNPYNNSLILTVNSRAYTIMPYESQEIVLDQGENVLCYYSENEFGKSETLEKTIFCDSIPPVVSIQKAVSNGKTLMVTGQISKYVDNLSINGQEIILGEFHLDGEPITFDYVSYDSNETSLHIKAIDALGNSFESVISLQW